MHEEKGHLFATEQGRNCLRRCILNYIKVTQFQRASALMLLKFCKLNRISIVTAYRREMKYLSG